MKNKFLFLVLFAVSTLSSATDLPYEWEANRLRYKLTAAEEALSELILKNHIQYDYFLEGDQFLMYATVHKITFVNNNEAVQKHNRIFISMYNTTELVDVKARAISKSGKVVLFDKTNLKELKDEESGSAFRIFAIEGIELGSEVEFYYVRKMYSDLFQRVFMQSDVPMKNASLTVTCPDHLKFDFKSYFGYPAVTTEVKDEKHWYTASMDNVPALKKEAFSFYDANLKRVEFKLAYNTGRSKARLYTWDDAAKRFFERLNTLSKDETKTVEKFAKTLKDDPSMGVAERVRNVEDRIKGSIKVSKEDAAQGLDDVSSIVKYKLASKEGITRLFIAVFGLLKIDCQAVVTCSREKVKFDSSFDSWSFLDDYVLYFPAAGGYVAPYVIETRYPLVPPDFTAQSGLFIEPIEVAGLKSGLAAVKEIPPMDYTTSVDNLDVDVKISPDFSSSEVRAVREFSGYNASFILPYFDLMTEEQRGNLVEELTKQTAPDAEIKKFTLKPGGNKFSMDVNFTSSHFLEKAGPRLLFKVGTLIGPQVEMYREEQRMTGIENEYNRGYDRVIRIHVPESYTVKNLKDLNFDIVYKEKENDPYLFQSSYVLNGSLLEIRIKEYYKQIFAPVERYEDYRKVINAAADFNKVTLVFEKTK
jgi:hypothetical protein